MRRGRVMKGALYQGLGEMREKTLIEKTSRDEPDNGRILDVELKNLLKISRYLMM